jgi:hypothetical protein
MISSKLNKDWAMQNRNHPSIVGRIMPGKAYIRRIALTSLMPINILRVPAEYTQQSHPVDAHTSRG